MRYYLVGFCKPVLPQIKALGARFDSTKKQFYIDDNEQNYKEAQCLLDGTDDVNSHQVTHAVAKQICECGQVATVRMGRHHLPPFPELDVGNVMFFCDECYYNEARRQHGAVDAPIVRTA